MNDKDKFIDADWAAELDDVEPLKGKSKGRVRLEDQIVDDLDWDEVDHRAEKAAHIRERAERFNEDESKLQKTMFLGEKHTLQKFVHTSRTSKKLCGFDPSMDEKNRKKLAAGEWTIDGRYDLHGHREEEAWQALNSYLHEVQAKGKRCVIVVTGKGQGYGPKKDMGIIKSQVCDWLEASPVVMGYHTCAGKHGGDGALYVLLRKLSA